MDVTATAVENVRGVPATPTNVISDSVLRKVTLQRMVQMHRSAASAHFAILLRVGHRRHNPFIGPGRNASSIWTRRSGV